MNTVKNIYKRIGFPRFIISAVVVLFLVSPQAGQTLMGDAQIGEYFRVFIAYGVIGFALILHAMEKRKEIEKMDRLEFDNNKAAN